MRKSLRFGSVALALALAAAGCSKKESVPVTGQPATLRAQAKWTGEAVFIERCRDCHRVHDKGGVVGPDLSNVGAQRSRFFLEQVLREPSKLYPGTAMPPYDTLPADQLKLVADYLESLK
jgi:L-cysteine S-thiosulfotransferase